MTVCIVTSVRPRLVVRAAPAVAGLSAVALLQAAALTLLALALTAAALTAVALVTGRQGPAVTVAQHGLAVAAAVALPS